jgi:hypothetical protein
MLRLANEHEPDSLSQQRMELRTVEIILKGYTPEHRLWAQLRQAGANRDDDNSLFRFLDEVTNILDTRLVSLEREVGSAVRGDYGETLAERFGSGFGPTLERLRSAYSDWTTIIGFLDNLDGDVGAPEDIHADDQILDEIEARNRGRRRTAKRPGEC